MTILESTRDDIFLNVRQTIVSQFELDPTAIESATTFTELDIDSIERVDLTLQLEKQFGIQLPDQRVKTCQTIGELADLVRTISEKQAAELQPALREN
ncbi:MAG TPA: acyl carrier protein [Ktedonobacteraceae bacterium]|nr:acyl carrier protein [Ktedonobacteraceae bacterium]